MTNNILNENKIDKLSSWFQTYSDSFCHENDQITRAVQLKVEHSIRVCNDMEILSNYVFRDSNSLLNCATIALLHDVGRFDQFKRFHTFADRKSVNHADLGLEIIRQNNLLSNFEECDQNFITKAIKFHNKRELPDGLDAHEILYCNLIRDADKIDIYKIAAEHYTNPNQIDKDIVEIGTFDIPEISDSICDAVFNKLTVDYSSLRTLNDFKLVQLGWVYDFNFPISLSLIKNRGHYDMIKNQIPDFPKVKMVITQIDAFIENSLTKIK